MNKRIASMTTMVLACACGVFAFVAILQLSGLGTRYGWLVGTTDNPSNPLAAGAIDRELFKLPNETLFAEVQQRPPFNEDRKPTQFAEPLPDKPVAPPVALNITLNGVILTPDVHLVMLTDKSKNLPVMIKEGMPLPGEQGGWTLTTIKPRSAIFNDGNSDVEVELSSAPIPPPVKPTPALPNVYAPPGTPGAGHVPTLPNDPRADDLQRRIEERRKQMREEAARQAQQQKGG